MFDDDVGHLTVMTTGDVDAPRVVARGQLDLSTAPRLEQAIAAAEQSVDGSGVLTIDVSGLEFIDSTGLQVLLDADVRAHRDARALVVVLGTGEARRVAELADAIDRLAVAHVR